MSIANSRPLPAAIKWAGTAFVLLHFFLLGMRALGSRSGPWPLPDFLAGTAPTSPQEPPEFTKRINEWSDKFYLGPLRIIGDYNFQSNQVMTGDTFFEVNVLGPSGNVQETRRYPDPEANFLVRHRQKLLAMQLAQDRYLPPLGGEDVEKKGGATRKITYWGPEDEGEEKKEKKEEKKETKRNQPTQQVQILHTKPETKAPRGQPLPTPSEGSLQVVKSYQRFLAKDLGDRPFEIVRHFRHPVLSMYLILPGPPDDRHFVEFVGRFRGIP